MQQDISGMNDTPHRLDAIPNGDSDLLQNEGRDPISGEQSEQPGNIEPPSPLEAAELLAGAAADQGEDSVLMVETIVVPDATEGALPEGAPLGTIDLDIASPWYRSRWLSISAGVVTTALTCAGTILLIQGMKKRKRQRALVGRMKTGLQKASFFSMRGASSRAQGKLSQLTNQLAGQYTKSASQLQKQLTQLRGPAQQASSRIQGIPRQMSSNGVSKRTRAQWGKSSQTASHQLSLLGEKARATSARTASQVQNSLSSMGTGISNGVANTGKSVQHAWSLGRVFAIGIGAGAVWASLFTPKSGEESRALLASTLQRLGKKGAEAKNQ